MICYVLQCSLVSGSSLLRESIVDSIEGIFISWYIAFLCFFCSDVPMAQNKQCIALFTGFHNSSTETGQYLYVCATRSSSSGREFSPEASLIRCINTRILGFRFTRWYLELLVKYDQLFILFHVFKFLPFILWHHCKTSNSLLFVSFL